LSRLAITGTSSFLGARLLRRMAQALGPDNVVAIDVAVPEAASPVRHHALDLTEPGADERLVQILGDEAVQAVAHLAFFTNPQRDAEYAHELESIGTLSLMAAAAAVGARRVVVRSFTAVYGARGQNPNFLTEERTLAPNTGLPWIRDKLEAEQHAASFGRRYRRMSVCVLRFAPLFGPGVRNFYTRVFDRRVVPLLMGFDPLVQLLHPDDALQALQAAIDGEARGAFNIVPRAAIPVVTALHLAGKVPVPVPHPLAYAAVDALWGLGLVEAPGGFLDYARYLCVADGERARRELGFEAAHTSRGALVAYLQDRHPAAPAESLGVPA
jgi:UDP-glucose 4-epimerase